MGAGASATGEDSTVGAAAGWELVAGTWKAASSSAKPKEVSSSRESRSPGALLRGIRSMGVGLGSRPNGSSCSCSNGLQRQVDQ